MPGADELHALHQRTHAYLSDVLLPFWMERAPDREHGGFLTWFDERGIATGETTKTFLSQIRLLYTFSAAQRAGCGGGLCAELARNAADFLLAHYWDDEHGGWYWIADRTGHPTHTQKIGYGQCFAMYAFASSESLSRPPPPNTFTCSSKTALPNPRLPECTMRKR